MGQHRMSKSNIEILLSEWGAWKRGENRRALGFPSQAAFHNVVVDGSSKVPEPDVLLVDDDLNRLDEAINKLHPDMRVVIIAHYVWIDPVKVKIDKLKISRTVYYRHYEFSHKQLAQALGGIYMVGYEPNYFVPTRCDNVGTQVV